MAGLIPAQLSDLVSAKLSTVIRAARGEREAAIAAIRATPAAKSPVLLVGSDDIDGSYMYGEDGDGAYDNGPPSYSSAGASIEGYERVMLYWRQSDPSQQTGGTVFLMDADDNWYRYTSVQFTPNETRQIVEQPLITEGFKRLYLQLDQPPDNSGGGEIKFTNVYLFPHNEEVDPMVTGGMAAPA